MTGRATPDPRCEFDGGLAAVRRASDVAEVARHALPCRTVRGRVAGEGVCDHPFLWGSGRTGPALARVGGRYTDDWHRAHLYSPRDVVPESKLPAYPWLVENTLDGRDTAKKMEVLRTLGTPYTDADIAGARDAVKGKTEMDALVAYLQGLGALIKSKR